MTEQTLEGYALRTWYTRAGLVEVYEIDMPDCCRRAARGGAIPFECPSCLSSWETHSKSERTLIEGIESAIQMIQVGHPSRAQVVLHKTLQEVGGRS